MGVITNDLIANTHLQTRLSSKNKSTTNDCDNFNYTIYQVASLVSKSDNDSVDLLRISLRQASDELSVTSPTSEFAAYARKRREVDTIKQELNQKSWLTHKITSIK